MAATSITTAKLTRNTALAMPATAAVNASDGALVTYGGVSDHKVLIILENGATSAKTATIAAGNGIQGVYDLEIPLEASAKKCIAVESAKYAFVSGENAGKILIKGTDTSVKVAAICLP